ncbi:MAG: ABC transporter ATP-binding protein/permease [Candidatus Heimdallarchaeota archaeon]|nr:ABC transporter ATP-binding protein/permease [Candidatus Heimdallarchaeota archaeon]MDH5644509.1 ABC transporter ATP-binding protein/permease [Candidatus Heimdallarchaeota archaeon]
MSQHSDAEKEKPRGSFGYSDIYLYKFMLSYLRPHVKELFKIFIYMIISAIATSAGPIILMVTITRFGNENSNEIFGIYTLDKLILDVSRMINTNIPSLNQTWSEIIVISFLYLLLLLVILYTSRKFMILVAEVGLKAEVQMRMDMFAHLQELDMSYHDKNEVGRIMSRLTSDIGAVRELLGGQVMTNISNILTVIFVIIIIIQMDFVLSIISIILIPLVIYTAHVFRKIARPKWKETRRTNSIMMANIGEAISGIKVTKGLNREQTNIAIFQKLNKDNFEATLNAEDINAVFFPLLLFSSTLGTVFIIIFGSLRVIDGIITVAALIAFLNYNGILFRPVINLGQFYQQLQDALTGAERVCALLDTKTKIPWNDHFPTLPHIKGDVVFDKLYFEYIKNTPVYSKFSLFVPNGKMIALVGKTGAGKTTIINILSRLYDFQEGDLKIDGTSIKGVSLQSYKSQIATVPQDFFLFSFSIRQNLKLGNPRASDEEMWKVLDLVGLKEFIEDLDKGLDTPVQERGGRLSVGQRQLLVFAAVLLANPRILILDEATSSIDVFSELKVQKAIKHLLSNRTSFVIAHRLSTIKDADTIVVIDQGDIVEQGTHQELLTIKGHYYNLVKNQIELSEIES